MNSYCQVGEVTALAAEDGFTKWASFTAAEQKKIVATATRDIEWYHRQPRINGVPWNLGNTDLMFACQEQSLYLINTWDARRVSEKMAAISSKSINDGVMSVNSPGGKRLGDNARNLVDRVLAKFGIMRGASFIRG